MSGILDDVVAIGDGSGNSLRGLHIKASPNPFRGQLQIELHNPGGQGEPVSISLLDVRGRTVARVFEGSLNSGSNRISWSAGQSGTRLPAGVYLIQATVVRERIQK